MKQDLQKTRSTERAAPTSRLVDGPKYADDLGDDSPASRSTPAKSCPSLTSIKGYPVGQLTKLGAVELVIGRTPEVDLQLLDSDISRRHVRVFRVDDRVYAQDLGSTNGTFVRDRRIETPVALRDGDHLQLGSHRRFRFNLCSAEEEAAAIELYESSVRDPTSGALSRGHLDRRLESDKRAFSGRSSVPLTLLFIDVDGFKRVNDTHGHAAGDAVLRVLAAGVQRLLRPEDALVRYGGDEFVVLCPNVDSRNGVILAERIRACVERLPFPLGGARFDVTVSVGVASGWSDEDDWSALVETADSAMFRAKRHGRNAISA